MRTRGKIVAAAHDLFLRRGYFPTTMRAIADTAGVAEKTLYLAFSNKPALLDAVIDAALSDAQQRTSPSKRDQGTSSDDAVQTLRAFAQTAASIMEHTARVLAIAEAAATMDPELALLRDRGHAAMRQRFEGIAADLNARGALAPDLSEPDAASTIYAVANDAVYLRLIDGYGWSSQQFAHWLERVLTAALLHPQTTPRPSRTRGSA